MARRAVPLGAFATAIGLGALTLGPLAVVMMQAGGGGGITAADLAALRFTVTQAALSALAHPVRLRLLREVLGGHTTTAARVSSSSGPAVRTCSAPCVRCQAYSSPPGSRTCPP